MKLQNSYAMEHYQKSYPAFTAGRGKAAKFFTVKDIPPRISNAVVEFIETNDIGLSSANFVKGYAKLTGAVFGYMGTGISVLTKSLPDALVSGVIGTGFLVSHLYDSYKAVKNLIPSLMSHLESKGITGPKSVGMAVVAFTDKTRRSFVARLFPESLYKSAFEAMDKIKKPKKAK